MEGWIERDRHEFVGSPLEGKGIAVEPECSSLSPREKICLPPNGNSHVLHGSPLAWLLLRTRGPRAPCIPRAMAGRIADFKPRGAAEFLADRCCEDLMSAREWAQQPTVCDGGRENSGRRAKPATALGRSRSQK